LDFVKSWRYLSRSNERIDNLRKESCNWSISARRQKEKTCFFFQDNFPINETWLTRIIWTRRAFCSSLLHHFFSFYVTRTPIQYSIIFFSYDAWKQSIERKKNYKNRHQLSVFFRYRHKYRCAVSTLICKYINIYVHTCYAMFILINACAPSR
jgi:hypothetical protein